MPTPKSISTWKNGIRISLSAGSLYWLLICDCKRKRAQLEKILSYFAQCWTTNLWKGSVIKEWRKLAVISYLSLTVLNSCFPSRNCIVGIVNLMYACAARIETTVNYRIPLAQTDTSLEVLSKLAHEWLPRLVNMRQIDVFIKM